jgi:hypothetical protein
VIRSLLVFDIDQQVMSLVEIYDHTSWMRSRSAGFRSMEAFNFSSSAFRFWLAALYLFLYAIGEMKPTPNIDDK